MDPHKGSLDTFNIIAGDWIHPKFPYSTHDVWHRMGIIGVFGHYVLSHLRGDLLEIGAGESTVYMNQLARIYGCKVYQCDIQQHIYNNALTVPGYICEDNVVNYQDNPVRVNAQSVMYIGSSDKFFEQVPLTPIAMAFIDGDHSYEQAKKDFFNVLPHVMDNGFILLHDTYPRDETWTTETTCGEVYKLRQELEKDDRFDCLTLVQGTAMSFGITIVRKKPKDLPYYRK